MHSKQKSYFFLRDFLFHDVREQRTSPEFNLDSSYIRSLRTKLNRYFMLMSPLHTCIVYLLLFICSSCDHQSHAKDMSSDAFHTANLSDTNSRLESHSSGSQTPQAWKHYTTSIYSIKYPEFWELDTTGIWDCSFVLFGPSDKKKDEFKENISLQIQPINEKKFGLDEYTALSEKQIIDRLAQSVILKSERSGKGNMEHHTLIYTCIQYLKPIKYYRRHWVIHSNAYVLSFVCEEADYQKLESTVNDIFNSFQLTLSE